MTYSLDQPHLQGLGFAGFRPLRFAAEHTEIPRSPGVYVVLLDPPGAEFLEQSEAGHFKGENPTVAVHMLEAKWLTGTPTMYVGRGGNLRARISLLARYGRGEPVAHRGGRYLWQLAQHGRLVVGWRREADPVNAEATLLDHFERAFGQLPFANLVRGARPAALA